MTDSIICAPMRVEARAIRRGLRSSANPPEVLRTGYGTARAADRAGELKAIPFGRMVVMGVGAGLTTDLTPGDLVVGTEVGLASCPSAPLLAGELRRAGLSARTGDRHQAPDTSDCAADDPHTPVRYRRRLQSRYSRHAGGRGQERPIAQITGSG